MNTEAENNVIAGDWAPITGRRPRGSNVTKFKATKLFITFPQNDIDKDTLIERVLLQYPDKVEWIVACNEDHAPTNDDQNAGVHAHLIMKFKGRQQWIYHDVWDNIGSDQHGNYQSMKGTMLQACEYVTKHGNYSHWGFDDFEGMLDKLRKKKNPKTQQVWKKLQEGATVRELTQDETIGSFVMMNMQKLEYYHSRVIEWEAEPKVIYGLYDNIHPDFNPDPHCPSRIIFDLLEHNLTSKRMHRQKQLWIAGEMGVGKSTLKMQLQRRFKCFLMKKTNPLEGYQNNTYQIIIGDELQKGQYKCQDLNSLFEGGQFQFRSRYVDTFKSDNPLVIIFSNYTPEEFYPNLHDSNDEGLKALQDRIHEFFIYKNEPIRIWHDPEDPAIQ